MTDQATRVVPAGWYQDPALAEQVRWWNGLAWTEHVREKPTVVAAPAAAAGLVVTATSSSATTVTVTETETTAARIAAARELERQFGISTSENEIIQGATAIGYGAGVSTRSTEIATIPGQAAPRAQAAPQATAAPVNPAVQQAAAGRHSTPRTGVRTSARTATGSAWFLALTPVLTFLAGIAAAYVFFYVTATPLVFVIAGLLPYLLGILWALSDGRTLTSRGYRPPSFLWALLGALVYLVVRRIRVPGSGPLAMFLVVGAVLIAASPASYSIGELRGLSNALTIQNTISSDYVSSGRAAQVNCPPFVDTTTPGTLYTCSATLATGVTKAVWVSIDGADGTFSYAMAI